MINASTAWQAPPLCQTCTHLAVWKGRGYGCNAPYTRGPLAGAVVCKGFSFVERTRPDRPAVLERMVTR